ncbi:hypothetical protein [Methylohalobius crimeensis]|uniref:hypothetical protein n=1 Tax=Methylohalobius crimeensis TaxID=244365 RepID=UPI0003B6D6D8|nr:hypothetical protein [Methylohalobius crimeensis]
MAFTQSQVNSLSENIRAAKSRMKHLEAVMQTARDAGDDEAFDAAINEWHLIRDGLSRAGVSAPDLGRTEI